MFILLAISTLFLIVLPVFLAAALRRRWPTLWLYFCVGVLTFTAAQLIHLPLNELLSRLGLLPEGATSGRPLLTLAIVAGLTAGLSEELARAVGFALLRRARRAQDALMMGLGHGGLEVMVYGGVTLASAAGGLWFVQTNGSLPLGVPAEHLARVAEQLALLEREPWLALAPVAERVTALVLHLSLSIMVWQAIVRRSGRFLVLAILYHAAVDFWAVMGPHQVESVWLIEAMLALLTLPAAVWAWAYRPQAPRSSDAASWRQELLLFRAALGKELFQQWRTRRLLIVGVVFLLFGMLSPLVARFTPELLGSLEGAEQFAELIPEPTIQDALGQYVKNLTQFGFLLAIILGMGSIVGEKEKGTAAMMLSKPLPRWAFVASKFVAQAAVYLSAFLVAAVGAYYYTLFLFSAPSVGAFALLNVLMFLWLLVFVAATLLASTLGRSMGAAAGLAALASVFLLLAGSLPQVGALLPGGLTAWTGQLAAGVQDIVPNTGSLAMSLVLILLFVISAIAAFERQEL